jgi:type VI secretion system secreted protein Hcp
MPIYVQYDVIKGDVSESSHSQWVEVNSFQWGVGRGISSPVGGSADRESSAPSVSEIVVTKPTDISTVKLLDEALEGDGKDVTIDFCKTDKGKLSVYLSFVINNTMISGYSLSSGGDRPQESLSFNFTKINCTDVGLGAKNDQGQPATVGYDLGQGKIL